MKTSHPAMIMVLLSVLFFAQLTSAAAVLKCNRYDTVDIPPGTKIYVVQNNVWGSSDSFQCIKVDELTGDFSVVSSNHNNSLNGQPASYPSIFKGCHWKKCTNTTRSHMPKQVSALLSATTSWSTVQPNSGVYNVSYDIWLNKTSEAIERPDGVEIMIWLNKRGGIQPFGSLIANTVSIDGTTWDIWAGNNSNVNIISYVRTTGVESVDNLDIKAFLNDAKFRGYVQSTWYLIGIEAGFEIWQDGVGLESKSFKVQIDERENLESPQQGSFESGIGLIRGWVCDAEKVVVEIDGKQHDAAYGTKREDTQAVCGDSNNGFGLVVNWNSDGVHRLRALADGVEFANVSFNVATLGVDFLTGVSGEYTLNSFPDPNSNVTVRWAEPHQNFVIAGASQSPASISSSAAVPLAASLAYLESPQQGSFESGIGLIRGWVCDAEKVVVEIDGKQHDAAYGTKREDTQAVCGDSNNGFGLVVNWNSYGDGIHRLRALADGMKFADVSFNVATLGVDFLTGVSGEYTLNSFPDPNSNVTVRWAEPHQNFVIVGNSNASVLILQAEDYDEKISSPGGRIGIEDNFYASNKQCVHIGPDSNTESEGIGDTLIYNFSVVRDFSVGVFEVQYSDDVGGNIIHIYLDGEKKGSFRTETTRTETIVGWNNFVVDSQKINLGPLSKGSHSIKLEMTKGGSYGVCLDTLRITNVELVELAKKPKAAYGFIKGLISQDTGLVRSADYDGNTTIYKNALAALAFIHEGDLGLAEGVFNFFNSKYIENSYNKDTFPGFNKSWDTKTGNQMEPVDHWVGDNAFLLLALNYYKQVTGGFGNYKEMVEGLITWLSKKAEEDTPPIIAEGLANMYAALKPFENSVPGIDAALLNHLENRFDERKNYQTVLDHIERGVLVFSDKSGFSYIDGFKRIETWGYNDKEIHALAAFSSENFINVEISAQILLAWKIWKSDLSNNLSYLETEFNKLWLFGPNALELVTLGLPYFVSYDQPNHGWLGGDDEPMIDPACYMLFYYWNFNPMAPGRKGY